MRWHFDINKACFDWYGKFPKFWNILSLNQLQFLAAHCLIKNNLPHIPKLARLGEWNRKTSPDCQVYDGVQKCAAEEVDAQIARTYSHPQYLSSNKNRHHDIAILYLKAPVTFTDFVRPLCIFEANIDHEDHPATVIGYGKTESAQFSDQLLAVELDVMKISICKQQYRIQDRTVLDTQLCAFKKNADTWWVWRVFVKSKFDVNLFNFVATATPDHP